MFEKKVALINSEKAPWEMKYKVVNKIGTINPKIKEYKSKAFVFRWLNLKFGAVKRIKSKNAAKSNKATILNKKAIPTKSPARKNLYLNVFCQSRNLAQSVTKNKIKFSAFAMFPSIIGKPKMNAKIPVIRKLIFLFLKSSLER